MSKKAIAPAAIVALEEALSDIYWYKKDLRSFITRVIDDPRILAPLDWSDVKRNVVSRLVDSLSTSVERDTNQLLRLMNEVVRLDDFSHLAHIEDGTNKIDRAKKAVAALRKLLEPHQIIENEYLGAEKRREAARQRNAKTTAVQQKLGELKDQYNELVLASDLQRRGYDLEALIRDLFELFDLDPRASFKIIGEQIDGAFSFEGTDYLFEGKWQKERVAAHDLDSFAGKVSRKLDNTLGLFLSIHGFSPDGIAAHVAGRRLIMLMDGGHLSAVLEGRISFPNMILRMRRYASQTGEILLPLSNIFAQTLRDL